jgi:hypothetical protein
MWFASRFSMLASNHGPTFALAEHLRYLHLATMPDPSSMVMARSFSTAENHDEHLHPVDLPPDDGQE